MDVFDAEPIRWDFIIPSWNGSANRRKRLTKEVKEEIKIMKQIEKMNAEEKKKNQYSFDFDGFVDGAKYTNPENERMFKEKMD